MEPTPKKRSCAKVDSKIVLENFVREYIGESNRVTREPTHAYMPRATRVGVTLSVERSRPVTHADGVKWKSSTHTTPRPTTDSTPR